MRFQYILLLAVSLLGHTTAQAATLVVPAGLNPGDPYHVIFVTSQTRNATSTNINDYNAFVQGVANTAGIGATIGVTWRAVGSTAATSAIDNIQDGAHYPNPAAPVFNQAGTLIANNLADLCDGQILAPVLVTEALVPPVPFQQAWSGSLNNCTNLHPNLLGTARPVLGLTDQTISWLDAVQDDATARQAHLYALSSQVTVPAPVPAPAAVVLMCLGIAAGIRIIWKFAA